MPIVDVPNTCEGCGACCIGLRVNAEGGEVPEDMVVRDEKTGTPYMKRRESDDACVALDPETLKCTIYPQRGRVCREFNAENSMCYDQLAKRQARVVTEEYAKVESLLAAAVEFAISRGLAPDVRFTDRRKLKYNINLIRTTFAADVRPGVLKEAEERMKRACEPTITFDGNDTPIISGVTDVPKKYRPSLGDEPGKSCPCGGPREVEDWNGRTLKLRCFECDAVVWFTGKSAAVFVESVRRAQDEQE
jgi:Fe-S-cluster containining protein